MNEADLDPRWEWVEIRDFGQRDPIYVKGACKHLEVIAVESTVDGRTLAWLCVTCDTRLAYA